MSSSIAIDSKTGANSKVLKLSELINPTNNIILLIHGIGIICQLIQKSIVQT